MESLFNRKGDAIDKAIEKIQQGIDEDAFDKVAGQARDIESREAFNEESSQNVAFHPESDMHRHYDIGPDLGMPESVVLTAESLQHTISDNEYNALVRSLNSKQKQFFYHVLHSIKMQKCVDDYLRSPFYCFY